ncbi:MAG: HIT domain-containing protein [Bacteroidetes bacterium]|nr:HIT domain-containing protein [Bacteroidota bacterium]MBU2585107.1 HIT domain-containing protein [Bacteroidota bacterium]
MKRLFSPWRSEYIESFHQETEDKSCVFCKAAGETPEDKDSLVVLRGEFIFVLMNRYPYNNGHLLILPYRHISNLSDLNENERLEIFYLLELSIEALGKALKAQGHNIGTNLGKVAGAGIEDHLHFHIVPRWNGDTNFMPVLNDIKLISEEMSKTKSKLVSYFKGLNK